MGNSNAKENYHSYQQYDSQYSLSNLLSGSCVSTTQASNGQRSLYCASHRSLTNGSTLHSIRASSKTVWPIPRFQSIFLPEFSIKEIPMKAGYTFLDIIAKGTYGKVYKVQKQETGQVFALKVINKAKIVAENGVGQAKQEVAIQRMVGHHPFIVNSIHRWQSRKTLYILMDYISGGELLSLVDVFGCLPEEVVRIYVAEIALAIDFLHNAGIVHRDLKTSNVLLDEDGHAVIIDFGFAKWLQRTERTNTLCGTPHYMAPEILRREYYGHEVDWWSLGVLACFLLTNEILPFCSARQRNAGRHRHPIPGVEPAFWSMHLDKKQYPSTLSSEYLPDQDDLNYTNEPGTLPTNVDISPAARDLLKRLLQPEPHLRLRSLLSLQRIAFYMGCDIQSYALKKDSPFQILGVNNRRVAQQKKVNSLDHKFSNFESFPDGSAAQTSHQ